MAEDDHRSLDELAALHDGLAHPARVALLRRLRDGGPVPVAELVSAVSAAYRPVDTRTVQHHLFKMQTAGIVSVSTRDARQEARLARDVALVVRVVPADDRIGASGP